MSPGDGTCQASSGGICAALLVCLKVGKRSGPARGQSFKVIVDVPYCASRAVLEDWSHCDENGPVMFFMSMHWVRTGSSEGFRIAGRQGLRSGMRLKVSCGVIWDVLNPAGL